MHHIRQHLRKQREGYTKSLRKELSEMKTSMKQEINQELHAFILEGMRKERRGAQSPVDEVQSGRAQ